MDKVNVSKPSSFSHHTLRLSCLCKLSLSCRALHLSCMCDGPEDEEDVFLPPCLSCCICHSVLVHAARHANSHPWQSSTYIKFPCM